MLSYVVHLEQVNRNDLDKVGGKGANLGELLQAGFPVPPGYCITMHAYDKLVGQSAQLSSFYEQLNRLQVSDIEGIRRVSETLRTYVSGLPIPSELSEAILNAWREISQEYKYAVRSSATAEDLPTASLLGSGIHC